MLFTNILKLAFPFIFFLINIGWTQKIYNGRNLTLFLCLSLLLPVMLIFIPLKMSKFQVLNISMLLFYYFVLLVFIKMSYKKINNFLVRNRLLAIEFSDKDFTYVHWNSHNPTSSNWWDERRAKKPSWLDYILTFITLTFPFLIGAFIYSVSKNVS